MNTLAIIFASLAALAWGSLGVLWVRKRGATAFVDAKLEEVKELSKKSAEARDAFDAGEAGAMARAVIIETKIADTKRKIREAVNKPGIYTRDEVLKRLDRLDP